MAADERDLAQCPLGDEFLGLEEMAPTPLLGSRRNDPMGRVNRFQQRFSLVQAVRDGLFDIDVFARLQRLQRHRHVPVIRRSDDDGVHLPAVEGATVVRVRLHPGIAGRDRLLHAESVCVRHCAQFGTFDVTQMSCQPATACPAAYQCDANAVIGSQHSPRGHGGLGR